MKAELEEALKNISTVCTNAKLTMNEHIVLAQNIELLRKTIETKPDKKKGGKDGNNQDS